jgi:hypothetical protein
MILEATPSVPLPDPYFWYSLVGILGTIVAFFFIKWFNAVDAWMKESAKRFELIILELRDMSKTQAVQTQVIEAQGNAIEENSKEVATNIKLANETALMLQFLNGRREIDDESRKMRGKQ